MSRDDTISRQAAIDAINKAFERVFAWDGTSPLGDKVLENVPSARPEVKEIGYAECANAMLKMWIDNVLTDGEYNRIMDKLNAHHNAGRRQDE